MKLHVVAVLVAAGAAAFAAPQPWRRIDVPTYAEARAGFASPPPEYAMTLWWFWNSAMSEADIRRDLDDMRAHGVRSVMIWCYKGLAIEYLSPTWFERVRYAVDEAARRDMRAWIMDEGGYPSGFMGGRISSDFPDLRMQVLLPGDPPHPAFRTPPTRYVHMPGFAKDQTYSLFDALNPAATRVFLEGVHEKYREALGDHLGKTLLGIMGDEPSFPGVPWTATLPAEFLERKGYDVRPYLSRLFAKPASDEDRRIHADYWDVWTDLYRDNFFKPQSDWCSRHNIDYIVHLCGEEDMKQLVALNGDYFKCQRYVGIPGVDAIWRQIWPGVVADYPKLASSEAHMEGVPRAFTESFAVYGRGLSLEQAKWVMDQQFVRGINQFQTMLYLSSQAEFRPYFHPPDWHGSPQWAHFAMLAEYSNRASYLLSIGRPTARIALYYPTTSGWLGDFEADRAGLALARGLLERQRDFDFIDEDGLSNGVEVASGALRNRSGQLYSSVIVPPVSAISSAALGRLKALAASGGRVIFAGHAPLLVVGRTFRDAAALHDDLSWAVREPSGELGSRVLAALPEPDVTLSPAAPAVKYLHRSLLDAEVYLFFNESDRELRVNARLSGRAAPEFWDAASGHISAVRGWARDGASVRLDVDLQPYESRFVVLGAAGKAVSAPADVPERVTSIDGEWSLKLNGRTISAGLRAWSDLGFPGYSGAATYTKTVQVPAGTRHVSLDLGEVRYSARVRVNGRDCGAKAWRPFRWDITAFAKPGENRVEIEVLNTAANDLSGNPEKLKEVESKGWLVNSYIRIYAPFDREMVPSGLLGPVRLLCR